MYTETQDQTEWDAEAYVTDEIGLEEQYADHLRHLATLAATQADAVFAAVADACSIAMEKADRPLTENEQKALASRALIGTLYEERRTCAMCCSAITAPGEAMALGRYLADAEAVLYELIHLPSAHDVGETCFSRARRSGVYSSVIAFAPMPTLLVTPRRESAVEIGRAA